MVRGGLVTGGQYYPFKHPGALFILQPSLICIAVSCMSEVSKVLVSRGDMLEAAAARAALSSSLNHRINNRQKVRLTDPSDCRFN